MPNNERAGSLSDNTDQLFKVEITVTESQSKKSLKIHFEIKKSVECEMYIRLVALRLS